MIARILAAVIIALLAALVVQTARLHSAQMQAVTLRLYAEQARLDATTTARHAEQRLASAANAAAEQYEKGKQDAKDAADSVIAGLNAGTLKLRREWAGCETQRLSDAAAATRELDAAIASRNDRTGRIVRAVDACDAQVSGLQVYARAVMHAVNGEDAP